MPQTSLSFKRVLTERLFPFLALAAICVINSFIIHKLFSVSQWRYLQLYLEAGPFISLALAAFGAAWGALDKNEGLVAADPNTYVKACAKLAGLPIFAFGGHLRTKGYNGVNPWNVMLAIPLILLFVVASFAWLLLVAPLQYFLFLICGAPSRLALESNYRLHADLDGAILKFSELSPGDPTPATGWDASMRDKPVTMANSFAAVVLFILGYLTSR